MEIRGIILAARPADDELTRIAGVDAPQALPVANLPIVRHALAALRAGGIEEIAVVVSGETEPAVATALAEDSGGGPVTLIRLKEPPSLGGSLAAARDFLGTGAGVVLPGDALMLAPLTGLLDAWRSSRADVLVLRRPGGSEGKVRDLDSARALRLVDGTTPPPAERMLAGTYVLSNAAIDTSIELAASGRGDIAATVEAIMESGGSVETATASETWQYAGTVDGLLEANRIVLDTLERELTGVDVEAARVEGRVSIHPSAVLERTTIRGPAVIGAGAVLVDAFVGPYTAIGEGVRLDGAEVEYSIVLPGATIRHPGRRLEASLIGRLATVSRDFTLPSALRLRVGPGAEVSLS